MAPYGLVLLHLSALHDMSHLTLQNVIYNTNKILRRHWTFKSTIKVMRMYYRHATRSRQCWTGAAAVISNSIMCQRVVTLSSNLHNLHTYSWPSYSTYGPNLYQICLLYSLGLDLSWWVRKCDWGSSRGWTLKPVCTHSKRAKNLLPLKTGKSRFLSRAARSVYTVTVELSKTVYGITA